MYKDLGLKDLLKIIRNAVKNDENPQEAVLNYDRNLNGGYTSWEKQALQLGIDPSLFDLKKFYDDNPEEAWNLIQGKSSGELLLYYLTPLLKQKEGLIQQQLQRGSINDLMDYSKYEKDINDYMNKSVNSSMYAYGGPVNIYADGTDDIFGENTMTSQINIDTEWTTNNFPSFIDISPEELSYFNRILLEENEQRKNDESMPEEYRNLPRTMLVKLPHEFIKRVTPYELKGYQPNNKTTYYIQELIDDLLEDTDNITNNRGKENKNKRYRLLKLRLNTPEGRAYEYWNNQQLMMNLQELEGTTDLPNIEVYPGKYRPNSLKPLEIGERKPIQPFADYLIENNDSPFRYSNGVVPSNVSNRRRLYLPNMPEYLFDYLDMSPYPLEPWNIKWLLAPDAVPIPYWDVEQIRDDYRKDNSDFLRFMANLLGNMRNTNDRDELMQRFMQPKDYFADSYNGEHYTDAPLVSDMFNNDPYSIIEAGGNAEYANGGLLNYIR